MSEKEINDRKNKDEELEKECLNEAPPVVEEIVIEELAVDGICGIY